MIRRALMYSVLWPTFGIFIGSATQGTHQVSPDWTVDFRMVGAVLGIVLPATWYIARCITKIVDRLDAADAARERLHEEIRNLPCYRTPFEPPKKCK